MTIRVGTSGWSYPTGKGRWNGVFYPAGRRRGFDELAYYAEHFNSVEVNSTFYRVPTPAMASAWLARTPSSFAFSVKLYQKFTHPDMYLARAGGTDWTVTGGDLDEFRIGIEPLARAGRLTAVLVQFPASFQSVPETRAYLDWLAAALGDYPLAVELRHRSWSDEHAATNALLGRNRASWVYIDEPKFPGSIEQNLSADPGLRAIDSPLLYVRLHGRNAERWWTHDEAEDRYDYLYSPAELQPFAERARQASAAGRRVAMYLNNHFSAKAVANAAVLKHQIGDLVPGNYLPEMVSRYPDLAGIVVTSGLPL
jgi:uncharacterized protein YecE (DUF72 family)